MLFSRKKLLDAADLHSDEIVRFWALRAYKTSFLPKLDWRRDEAFSALKASLRIHSGELSV